jgi:hypothetical protein
MSEKRARLIKLRKSLLEQLNSLSIWVDGSIVETTRIQSGKKKAFNYLSRSKDGKNHITYISAKRLEVFKDARESGKQAKCIIDKIIEINIQLLKIGESEIEQ